jgi:hypothetical protein
MKDLEGQTGINRGTWSNSRRYIRFKPDTSTYAGIDTRTEDKAFIPQIMGLVYEESSYGCGMVLIGIEKLQVGDICRIQVGGGTPVEAQVRWRKEIDCDVVRIGFMYLKAVQKAG